MKKVSKAMTPKISEYAFIVRAIRKLRVPPYKGIHSVYSGFNQAFRDYFNRDPVQAVSRVAAEGKIVVRPVKGGVLLYLPEDVPRAVNPSKVLDKILDKNFKGPAASESQE